jgi:hypothetical protein
MPVDVECPGILGGPDVDIDLGTPDAQPIARRVVAAQAQQELENRRAPSGMS